MYVFFYICVLIISPKTLKEKLSLFTSESEGENKGGDEEERSDESSLTSVKDSLDDIITLCHQSSQNLSQQQREVMSVSIFKNCFLYRALAISL